MLSTVLMSLAVCVLYPLWILPESSLLFIIDLLLALGISYGVHESICPSISTSLLMLPMISSSITVGPLFPFSPMLYCGVGSHPLYYCL